MKNPLIATHNGYFHADDIFGLAVLLRLFPDAELVRTRDPAVVTQADFAVDVGGEWDETRGRFDHHQKGFAGAREDGTVYASAGLVWKTYGARFVQTVKPETAPELAEQVARAIDEELVAHIDRADTGAARGAPDYFGLSMLLDSFNLTREEEVALCPGALGAPDAQERAARLRQQRFLEAVTLVQRLVERLATHIAARFTDQAVVRQAERLEDGQVLLLPQPGLAWEPVVVQEMPDVLFVVYPDSTDQQYQVRTVPQELGSFKARKDLPAPWAGLRDLALAQVTGLPDAVFCHNARFIAGAGSKESALALARQALHA